MAHDGTLMMDQTTLVKRILACLDLTSLNDDDTEENIAELCQKSVTPLGQVAAVCVYPKFVTFVASKLKMHANPPLIDTVANFPNADEPLDVVLDSIQESIANGAKEIDVVFPYPIFFARDKMAAHTFISRCKEACGTHVTLKVILETGILKDITTISEVSRSVILAGADFIKTSTGKITIGATPEAATTMLLVIKELSQGLNRRIGFKASGGVRTFEDALQYLTIAEKIMGTEWVSPATFRIGASKLYDELLIKLQASA